MKSDEEVAAELVEAASEKKTVVDYMKVKGKKVLPSAWSSRIVPESIAPGLNEAWKKKKSLLLGEGRCWAVKGRQWNEVRDTRFFRVSLATVFLNAVL